MTSSPMSLNQQSKNGGFTLLELLIAMVIFSFMSIMAYSALSNILTSNVVITAQEKKLKKLQRAMMFIERDMRQVVSRPRRSGYDQLSKALASGLDDEGIIEFTRAGHSNPTDLVRSSLQRVRYDLDDKVLLRMSWNLVDHIDAEPITMPLLNDVEGFSLRFLDKNNAWKENWEIPKQIPKAIELTLEHKHWGKIIRLIPVQ